MASQREHDIITAVTALIAAVHVLPASNETRAVVAAVEDLRATLGAVGYPVPAPAWMSADLLARSRTQP